MRPDDLEIALRARLRELATLVDDTAPAPMRMKSERAPLRPNVRVPGASHNRVGPATSLAGLSVFVVVVLVAVGLAWSLGRHGAGTTSSPSPSPRATASWASPTPLVSGGSSWPIAAPCGPDQGTCLFGPDGSLFVVTSGSDAQVTAYDPSGRVRPGWPITAPTGANYNGTDGFAVAGDGSLLVATPGSITDLDPSGHARSISVSSGFAKIIVESSGRVIVVDDDPTLGETWVYALDLAGDVSQAWSTKITGDISAAAVGHDGEIFLASANRSGGSGPQLFAIASISNSGKIIADWSSDLWNAMTVTPSGSLAVVSYDTRLATTSTAYDVTQTHLAVLGTDLKPLTGWPRVVDGPASTPVAGADGSLYVVLGDTIATGSVLALDATGNREQNWPQSLPLGFAGLPGDQSPGHLNVSQSPTTANGLVYVAAASHDTGQQAILAFPTSGAHSGWQYAIPGGCEFMPSWGTSPLATSADGSLYALVQISPTSGEVLSLSTEGKDRPGWPYVFSPGPLGISVLNSGVGVYSTDFATVRAAR
jgi:hypothetical protein